MPNTYPRGSMYIWDPERLKMLSINRIYLRAGTARRTVANEYLQLEGGQPSMTVGDALIRDATLISVTANCETTATWTLKVFAKGNPTPLAVLPMISNTTASNPSLNKDVPAGTVIQFFAEGSNIPFPRGLLELAWR